MPQNYYDDQDKDKDNGGPGLGSLAALLGGAALAFPTGRPIRRVANNYYQAAFGNPFAESKLAEVASKAFEPVKNAVGRGASAELAR